MKTSVRSKLAEIRSSRGVAAAEIAKRVGVTRQTIYAIEEANRACRLRSRNELTRGDGRARHRRRSDSRAGFQRTGAALVEGRKSSHRGLSPGRSHDRRVQLAVYPPRVRQGRYRRSDVCRM